MLVKLCRNGMKCSGGNYRSHEERFSQSDFFLETSEGFWVAARKFCFYVDQDGCALGRRTNSAGLRRPRALLDSFRRFL